MTKFWIIKDDITTGWKPQSSETPLSSQVWEATIVTKSLVLDGVNCLDSNIDIRAYYEQESKLLKKLRDKALSLKKNLEEQWFTIATSIPEIPEFSEDLKTLALDFTDKYLLLVESIKFILKFMNINWADAKTYIEDIEK